MLWFAVLTAAAAGPQQEVLENGLTVTVLSDPVMPHLVVQHWIEGGSASDPPTHPGIAHLVEHLMVRDSGLEARIDTLGGTLSAYTAPDYTRYSTTVSPDALDEALRILTPLSLNESTLASVRRVVAEELAQRGGYTARLRALIDAAYWRTHPYAAAAGWMMVDPDALTASACVRFIEAHYRPDTAHLVIVGPIEPDDALQTVQSVYGELQPSGTVTDTVTHVLPSDIKIRTGPSAVRLAGLIWPLPPTDHPDQPALSLLLSGLHAEAPALMSGALSAGGHVSWGREGSRLLLSGVYSAVRTDERLETDLQITRMAMSTWPTEARVEDTRARLVRQTLKRRTSPDELARSLGWSVVMRGTLSTPTEDIAQLQALTWESLESVWSRWISAADPVEVRASVD